MTRTASQPTAAPTRKMWAVILAAVIVGGASAGMRAVPALAPFADTIQGYEAPLAALLIPVAGYFTRERA